MKGLSANWRRENVGRYLNQTIRRFEKRVIELVEEAGYSSMRVSYLNLTRNLDLEGTRITELADRAGMTKQSMSELVAQCIEAGLVKQQHCAEDARAKPIAFTRRGLALLGAFRDAIATAEGEMRDEIGADAFALLSTALAAYGGRFETLKQGKRA